MERDVPLEILGELPKPMNALIREVLERVLGGRPERFIVHLSRPHADVIVHIQQPFDKKLKFTRPLESEIARELYAILTAIVDEECRLR